MQEKIVAAVEGAATGFDRLAGTSGDPANAVLPDEARLVRWAAPLFLVGAVVLVPWIVLLGLTLPERQLSDHYDIAWAGYDVLLFTGLALTGLFAARRSALLPIAASGTGALLTADAWFDVLTSPGGWGIAEAIVLSVAIELPVAAICFWLAVHSQDIASKRIRLLLRRTRQTTAVPGHKRENAGPAPARAVGEGPRAERLGRA